MFGRILTMKILISLLVICAVSAEGPKDIFSTEVQSCDVNQDVTKDYRNSVYEFTALSLSYFGHNALTHFVFSPLSIWIILAAVAEGADPATKEAMFQFLYLPEDPCKRLKYYQIATSRFQSGYDVYITNTRALVVGEGVTINPNYHDFVFKNSLLDVVSAPLRHDPQSALAEIRRITSAKLLNLDLSGNSVILDAVDYRGLWNTAFEDAVIERAPFYSKSGEQIGSVDLMKVRRRAKMTYVRSTHSKSVEIPIGNNDRYRMIFGLALDNNTLRALNDVKSTVFDEYLSTLKESFVPIDIAIPRFNITAEYDVNHMLEDFGMLDLWKQLTSTGYISEPAATPSAFVHHATLSLDTAGLMPAPQPESVPSDAPTGLDPILGKDFIANKPFLFGLFDSETFTCIMATGFAKPTYTN